MSYYETSMSHLRCTGHHVVLSYTLATQCVPTAFYVSEGLRLDHQSLYDDRKICAQDPMLPSYVGNLANHCNTLACVPHQSLLRGNPLVKDGSSAMNPAKLSPDTSGAVP